MPSRSGAETVCRETTSEIAESARDTSLADFCRQRRRQEGWVNLERQRLVVEIQKMLVVSDAGERVLGSVVRIRSNFRISVVGHLASHQHTT